MFAHGETITRLRGALVVDPYSGEATEVDWTNPDELDIPGWGIAQDATSEPVEVARESIRSDFTLYRQEPADVLATDRLVIDGLTCQVDGHPFAWHQPMTGWAAGFVVRANIVEG